jgi:hypothetical protein
VKVPGGSWSDIKVWWAMWSPGRWRGSTSRRGDHKAEILPERPTNRDKLGIAEAVADAVSLSLDFDFCFSFFSFSGLTHLRILVIST